MNIKSLKNEKREIKGAGAVGVSDVKLSSDSLPVYYNTFKLFLSKHFALMCMYMLR